MKYQPVQLSFPLGGIDVSRSFGEQTPTVTALGAAYDPSFQQQKMETCRAATNVRGWDPLQKRFRGGTRCGVLKYAPTQVANAPMQGLGVLTTTGLLPPSGSLPAGQSKRLVYLVGVAAGTIGVTWAPSGTAWVTPTSGGSALSSTMTTIQMAPNRNTTGVSAATTHAMYFVDGQIMRAWVPATGGAGTVTTWSASSGSLPGADGADTRPRLICTWRGRTVLAGLKSDPNNWFMSAVGDPRNWNYGVGSTTSTQAIAGAQSASTVTNNGLVGDVVVGLVPINDNNLLFLCNSSTWIMRGDPMAGGTLQVLEPGIGGIWGQAWCQDAEGVTYWVTNKFAVYQFSQFDYPRRISQHVDPLLQTLADGGNVVSMVWDDFYQGFHLFVTAVGNGSAASHFFWEKRTGAWWQDSFGATAINPYCCAQMEGNSISDRRPVIGSFDGVARYFEPSQNSADDGNGYTTSVTIGPITSNFAALMVKQLLAILGTSSGTVTWSLYSGATAESALSSTPITGSFAAGVNRAQNVRLAGRAFYLKLTTSAAAYALEKIQVMVAPLGAVRERVAR